MRVLVTGGTGDIGRATVRELLRNGHSVRVIAVDDVPNAPMEAQGDVEYVSGTILDVETLAAASSGCDSVVHLAALRGPAMARPETIFAVNVAGTFNVYQAAADAGIRRVVSASSINAAGFKYGTQNHVPSRLPVDESHPLFTSDPYSFSKQSLEEVAAYFWRRYGITGTCLRFPAIYLDDPKSVRANRDRVRASTEFFTSLVSSDTSFRAEFFARFEEELAAFRAGGAHEPGVETARHFSDRALRAYVDSRDLFAVCDVRDAARAIQLSLVGNYSGTHPLFIADRENGPGVDSRSLASLFFPHAFIADGALPGCSALISTERATRLIGFVPEYPIARLRSS